MLRERTAEIIMIIVVDEHRSLHFGPVQDVVRRQAMHTLCPGNRVKNRSAQTVTAPGRTRCNHNMVITKLDYLFDTKHAFAKDLDIRDFFDAGYTIVPHTDPR